MIAYYLNGQEIGASAAARAIIVAGLQQGRDIEEIRAIWNSAEHSEEARDSLFEISGYSLEIVCND